MYRWVGFVGLVFGMMAARSANAHRVGADAWVSEDGATIQVEAWLSGGKTPKKGTVIVLLPDGSEYVRGPLTEGVFSFKPTQHTRFTFNVQLGQGDPIRLFSL